MKKKLLSLLMALVMLSTILPLPSLAAAVREPLGGIVVESTGESSGQDNKTEDGTTSSNEGSEEDGGLLLKDTFPAKHPAHLLSGEVDFSNAINPKAGKLVFTKESETLSGSVKLSNWSISEDGKLSFSLSAGKTGDMITFAIKVSSEKFSERILKVEVTLGYERLMITSPTTVTYGESITLSCVGLVGNGAVIYSVVGDSTGAATITGNILTATKAGEVKISAVQTLDGESAAEPSDPVTITINKATPTGSPTFTKLEHAGLTLADAALKLGKFSVDGTVEWVLSDSTIVVANTAYEWEFTPKDTENYNTIKGTVTPYTVKDNAFAAGEGVTEENPDGSFTTISFGEDDSSYKLTEYPDGSMKMVHTKPDGTVTTTELTADGTRTETIENKDGSRQITARDKTGISHTTISDKYGYTTVQISLPASIINSAVKSGAVISLPIPEIPCTDDRSDAPVITFTLSTKTPVRVSIPVNSPTAGTVAITVAKNGQESIVKTCTTGYDSVEVTLNGSTAIKVADLSKRFADVDRRHWYKDAVDFATSRGLFNGVTPFEFDANGHMSRAMLVQVLHNLEGNPHHGYDGYYGYAKHLSDVEGKWYEASAVWAIANGHIGGYEDGTFRGELDITREQLAVILYRYAGYPSANHYVNTSLTDYLDYQNISPYAYEAMYWALCSGVLYTAGGDKLSPQQPVTRAEVAQTFKNLVEFLVK